MEQVDLIFVLIFFLYGLAFFSMGLTTILEAVRAPSVQAARILRPLAAFGFTHGMHEWLEMILHIVQDIDGFFPDYWNLARIGLLAFSFASLIGYGVQVFSLPDKLASKDLLVGSAMLGLYGVSLYVINAFPTLAHMDWAVPAEFMSRYILATPGALIASMALTYQARRFLKDGRAQLSRHMRWASLGFGLYGVTQFLGPIIGVIVEINFQPETAASLVQYPIPAVRAILAAIITVSLIRMTQALEQERRQQLLQAQLERVEALEDLQSEMQKRHDLRKQLLRKTVALQEEERARISRELHDETAQILTGFNANLAALTNEISKDGKSSTVIEKLKLLSDQMSDSIHRLVRDLRPAQLDELGIHSAIQHLVDSTESNFGLKIEYHYNRPCNRIDSLLETVIYRLVQEALTNVAKHAETDRAEVTLDVQNDFIEVSIRDHGTGFVKMDQHPNGGFGLLGLEERVGSLGGKFDVRTQPKAGTVIYAWFPLEYSCDEENENGR